MLTLPVETGPAGTPHFSPSTSIFDVMVAVYKQKIFDKNPK